MMRCTASNASRMLRSGAASRCFTGMNSQRHEEMNGRSRGLMRDEAERIAVVDAAWRGLRGSVDELRRGVTMSRADAQHLDDQTCTRTTEIRKYPTAGF